MKISIPEEYYKQLSEKLLYDPELGSFIWKTSGRSAGTTASGYRRISTKIRGREKLVSAARLAWYITHGKNSTLYIDHINRNKLDDRICNLREVTNKENQENKGLISSNKSGFRGVHFSKSQGRYRASIRHHEKNIHIGYFDCPEEASVAYERKRKELFTHGNVISKERLNNA